MNLLLCHAWWRGRNAQGARSVAADGCKLLLRDKPGSVFAAVGVERSAGQATLKKDFQSFEISI
jgi:hypothetical protein